MTSLLNHSSEPTTTQNDSGILVSTYLMNQLVWSILGALLCFVFQDIYNHRKCFLASLTQLAVEVVIAVALSLGVIAVGNNWLSFCIGLLFYTWFHRPSNLFGGLRRSVKRVFCTAAVLVIVTVLGTLWMLWCLVVHLINLVEMFRLPVALVLLTLGTVCEHAPLILRLLAFVICLYLSFLIKRAPVENRRGATSPIVHQALVDNQLLRELVAAADARPSTDSVAGTEVVTDMSSDPSTLALIPGLMMDVVRIVWHCL